MKVTTTGTTITFAFDGHEAVTFDANKTHAAMRDRAMMHGWEQRIRDRAAIQRTKENNFTVTEEMRRNAVLEMVTHYESGTDQWNLRAAATPKLNPVFVDIAARRGCSYEEAEKWYAEKLVNDIQAMIDAGK